MFGLRTKKYSSKLKISMYGSAGYVGINPMQGSLDQFNRMSVTMNMTMNILIWL